MKKNAHRLHPEHRAMTLPLPRAKRKERFDSDFDSDSDFETENIPPCILIFIEVEIEIAIGIGTLAFSSLASPRCRPPPGRGGFRERLILQAFHFARGSRCSLCASAPLRWIFLFSASHRPENSSGSSRPSTPFSLWAGEKQR